MPVTDQIFQNVKHRSGLVQPTETFITDGLHGLDNRVFLLAERFHLAHKHAAVQPARPVKGLHNIVERLHPYSAADRESRAFSLLPR
jgi:hypothetical protein